MKTIMCSSQDAEAVCYAIWDVNGKQRVVVLTDD